MLPYYKVSYSSKLQTIIDKLNKDEYEIEYDKLITETYCRYNECERNFFSLENGLKIDYCMNIINRIDIDELERCFLLASLMTAINKIANTTGVYGAYLKHIKKAAEKSLFIIPIHKNINIPDKHTVYNDDIENLNVELDVVYLDPPYNQRQYSSNYFLLNYILHYDKNIKIKGKTGVIEHWNRSGFCSKQKIKQSLDNVLTNIKCKYLAFSYSNEALLSIDELQIIFSKYFDNIVLYEQEHSRYKSQKNNTGKKIIEYLFVCH